MNITTRILTIILLLTAHYSLLATSTDDLLDAALKGDLPKAEAAIKAGADVNVKDNNGNTPVIWASGQGYFEIVKLLIEHNADVNAKTNDDRTALRMASEKGHLEIVKLLVYSKAEINLEDKNGKDVFVYAAEGKSKNVFQYWLETIPFISTNSDSLIAFIQCFKLANLLNHFPVEDQKTFLNYFIQKSQSIQMKKEESKIVANSILWFFYTLQDTSESLQKAEEIFPEIEKKIPFDKILPQITNSNFLFRNQIQKSTI